MKERRPSADMKPRKTHPNFLIILQALTGMVMIVGGEDPLASGPPFHQRLVKDLLDSGKYDPRVRPVIDHNKPVLVNIRMNLYQILEVNEPRQKLVLYVWVTQYWKDEFLRWDPTEYEGIDFVVLPYDKVWLPDTYLYNSLDMKRDSTERWISVIFNSRNETTVGPNGTESVRLYSEAAFQYPAIYQISCKMNILLFPFDKQNCTLIFGSWTFNAAGIDYNTTTGNVSFESYVPNEEWRVLSFSYYREVIKYQCCPVPWILLHASLVMQRKPLYYIVNLIFPTAIITFIAVVGFFMPASTNGERVEKVNLGITTLLAMSILLLMVSDQMPTTSDLIPLIGWFYLSIILLISLGTIMTSVVILIHQQGHFGKRVPKWARHLLFECLGPCLAVTKPMDLAILKDEDHAEELLVAINRTKSGKKFTKKKRVNGRDELHSLVRASGSFSTTSNNNQLGDQQHVANGNNGGVIYHDNGIPILHGQRPAVVLPDECNEKLVKILSVTEHIRDYIQGKEKDALVMLEWEHACNVLDRFLLLLFSCAVAFVTFGVVVVGNYYNFELSIA